MVKEERVTLVVQVNGKVRDKIDVAVDISESEAKEIAQKSQKVAAHLKGEVVRVVYVPGRLVNFVVKK